MSTALDDVLLGARPAMAPPEAGKLPDASKLTVPTLPVSTAIGNARKVPLPRLTVSATDNDLFGALLVASGSPRANSASNQDGEGGIPYSC